MRGALTFLIFLFSVVLSLPVTAGATNSQTDAAGLPLEDAFEAAKLRVEDQLLNAPEASYIYLKHWIDIYNQSRPSEAAFPIPNSRGDDQIASRDYLVSNRQTDWRPNGFPVVSPEWRYMTPISLSSASQFRPVPPPDIDSQPFKQDARDVLIYGDAYSLIRSADQAMTSAFWANGPGTETPPGRWNIIALESSTNLPRAERIALMLKLNIALYDAGIAAFDAKYHYDYWRPQTALRHLFAENVDWEPMMQPPFHPEYVSGHSAFSGAAAAVLEHFLGGTEFCITAPELFDLERCYGSFLKAAEEAGRSRIYGGIHFEFSNQAGLNLGREVAGHVISNIDLSNRQLLNPTPIE